MIQLSKGVLFDSDICCFTTANIPRKMIPLTVDLTIARWFVGRN